MAFGQAVLAMEASAFMVSNLPRDNPLFARGHGLRPGADFSHTFAMLCDSRIRAIKVHIFHRQRKAQPCPVS
jgi:hypothetical protein